MIDNQTEMPAAERAAWSNGYGQGYREGYKEGYQDAVDEFLSKRSPHDANQDPEDKA